MQKRRIKIKYTVKGYALHGLNEAAYIVKCVFPYLSSVIVL